MLDAKKFELSAYLATIECPHCEHENSGFLSDPRGTDTECDECGEQFKIPNDIDVVIT